MPKAFARDWLANRVGSFAARSIVTRGMLRVVAEGVETQEELVFLQAHQCDEAQWYYFSPPVLPQQFASLLRTGMPEASVATHR